MSESSPRPDLGPSTLVLSASDVMRNVDALFLLEALRAVLIRGEDPPARVTQAGSTWMVQRPEAADAPHAIMPASHLRELAHAVLGALLVELLASPDAARVAIIGGDAHAPKHVKMLRLVRSLGAVRVFHPDAVTCRNLSHNLHMGMQLSVRSEDDAASAVQDADVVLVLPGAPASCIPATALREDALVLSIHPRGPGLDALALDAAAVPRVHVLKVPSQGALDVSRSAGLPTWVTQPDATRVDTSAAWSVVEAAVQDMGVMRLSMQA